MRVSVRNRCIAGILCIVMLLSLSGCRMFESETEREQRLFTEYCDKLFVEMLGDDAMTIHYTLAEPEKYGIRAGEATLGEFSVETIEKDQLWIEDTIKKLQSFDAALLTERQQLSLATLKAYFEVQGEYKNNYRLTNLFTTNTGLTANLTINFIEFVIESEEDVQLYLDLLKDTKRYIAQVLDYVRLQSKEGYFMSDYCVEANIETCQNYLDSKDANPMVASFEEKLALLELSEEKKKEYAETNKRYVKEYFDAAYQQIVDVLQELKGTATNEKGLCWFEGGKEFYATLLKEKSSTGLKPEEMITLLEKEMEQLFVDYRALYDANPDLLRQYLELDIGMSSPEEILTFLSEKVSLEFPQPYTKQFVVQYQSKACEIEGTLAYYLTARLDRLDYNSIKVNGSAFGEDYTKMYSTLAHEGFPGHLYQYTGVFGNEEIPNACKNLSFLGLTEGYAEYASDRAYVLAGFSEELTELMVLDQLYGYILQSRLDLGIHYEGWDKAACAAYCADYGIPQSSSDLVYDSLVADPGLLIPYTVGHIKMRELRKNAEEKLGEAFDPVTFHQWILDAGLTTFELLEQQIDLAIQQQKTNRE